MTGDERDDRRELDEADDAQAPPPGDGIADAEAPAIGVVDEDVPDPPEPSEPA